MEPLNPLHERQVKNICLKPNILFNLFQINCESNYFVVVYSGAVFFNLFQVMDRTSSSVVFNLRSAEPRGSANSLLGSLKIL